MVHVLVDFGRQDFFKGAVHNNLSIPLVCIGCAISNNKFHKFPPLNSTTIWNATFCCNSGEEKKEVEEEISRIFWKRQDTSNVKLIAAAFQLIFATSKHKHQCFSMKNMSFLVNISTRIYWQRAISRTRNKRRTPRKGQTPKKSRRNPAKLFTV